MGQNSVLDNFCHQEVKMSKVLFVCLGNICRSPAAEGVMKHLLAEQGVDGLHVDSAGTSAYHEGERADSRMIEHAYKRGIDLTSISRGLRPSDLDEFDYIIAMDRSNLSGIRSLAKEHHHEKIFLMSAFCTKYDNEEVPDPYYGGAEGFEFVLDMVTDGCLGLIAHIKNERD